jgi:hypothetical protein
VRPETRFTRSGDVYLAFQVVGQGDCEFLASFAGPTHLDRLWEPMRTPMLRGLPGRRRLHRLVPPASSTVATPVRPRNVRSVP